MQPFLTKKVKIMKTRTKIAIAYVVGGILFFIFNRKKGTGVISSALWPVALAQKLIRKVQ
jgi:hypothetical protein